MSISTPLTFPLITFLTAAIVNLFVPSGGGQWAVQGPVSIAAAKLAGADLMKTALCVSYGNTWTNLAQPFWAIATLGICGLKAKDIMGDTLSTYFEARAVYEMGCQNILGGDITVSAMTLAKARYDVLMVDGVQGKRDLAEKRLPPPWSGSSRRRPS